MKTRYLLLAAMTFLFICRLSAQDIEVVGVKPVDFCKGEKTYYSIEDALKEPEKVKKLDIGMRKIKTLSPEIGKLVNLECLDLSFNTFVSLPPEIGNLKNLKYLNISGTRFLGGVPEIIKQLPSLQLLDISDHPEWKPEKFEKAKTMLPKVTIKDK